MATQLLEPLIEDVTAPPAGRRRVLVRLAGELGTKSPRTRRRFLNTLLANARRALHAAGLRATVSQEWSRLWVDGPDPAAARRAVAHLFGVHSAVEVLEVSFESLPSLVDALEPVFRERVRGHTFGVRARRAGSSPVKAQDLAVALGAALLPVSAGVNLDDPQVEVRVLVGENRAYACGEESIGPGGLPLGSGGRALTLLSGGFDSPVAAWYVMRRGVELDQVHFDLGGCGQVEAAVEVAREFTRSWAPGVAVQLHVVDLAPLLVALEERCDRRLRQVLLKRAMYRAAGLLARELGSEALVTGEALAQVSTQTLRSLAVCEAAAGLPVLRPLIGMDKTEIIARAREIGTYEASERVQEHCSIAGGKVITWPRSDAVQAAEALVAEEATEAWTAAQVAGRRVIDLSTWVPEPAREEAPEVDAIPPTAHVVDVREPFEGEPVGELQLPYSIALERLDLLQPDREYVLVCTAGQRSAALAGELRRRGFTASSLRGGLRRLPR
jgi:tRNA uracil 4-sulfurtransferase